MKKILITYDGSEFSASAFEFARRLNELSPILLTGVFIPAIDYAALWGYASATTGPLYASMVDEKEIELLQQNMKVFESLCIKNNISFRVHSHLNEFALPELKLETRFADLLIINSEHFFSSLLSNFRMEYLREAIHEAECPVVVIPENYIFPSVNVIAYDGNASSVYAMKQFAYLLPELACNETLLVHSKNGSNSELPNQVQIEELAAQHFKNLTLSKLDIKPEKYFSTWVSESGRPIVICGALGRSHISQMFKKSFATDIIADMKLPVFIAHM